jgi:hypothetical protein
MSFILDVKERRVGRQGNVDAGGGINRALGCKNK